MTTRAEMSKATREKLVSVARELFATQPYGETTIDDIARAAGVTKGGVYHHYADKEQLLVAVQHDVLDNTIAESRAIVAQHLSPREELRALVGMHLRAVTEDRVTLSFSARELRASESSGWLELREKRDQVERFVIDTIDRGRESGDFRLSGESRLLAYGIFGMCYWSHVWYRPGGHWTLDDIADTLTDLALSGLCHPSERPHHGG